MNKKLILFHFNIIDIHIFALEKLVFLESVQIHSIIKIGSVDSKGVLMGVEMWVLELPTDDNTHYIEDIL